MRVPKDVDLRKATITVSVPAWKDRVIPLTIDASALADKPASEKVGK